MSHAHDDAAFADDVAEALAKYGIDAWNAPYEICGSHEWEVKVQDALDRCNWLILVVTPVAMKSKWVRKELSYALHCKRYDGHIVPLVYRECNYHRYWLLSDLQYVDFTSDFATGCQALLKVWGIESHPS